MTKYEQRTWKKAGYEWALIHKPIFHREMRRAAKVESASRGLPEGNRDFIRAFCDGAHAAANTL